VCSTYVTVKKHTLFNIKAMKERKKKSKKERVKKKTDKANLQSIYAIDHDIGIRG